MPYKKIELLFKQELKNNKTDESLIQNHNALKDKILSQGGNVFSRLFDWLFNKIFDRKEVSQDIPMDPLRKGTTTTNTAASAETKEEEKIESSLRAIEIDLNKAIKQFKVNNPLAESLRRVLLEDDLLKSPNPNQSLIRIVKEIIGSEGSNLPSEMNLKNLIQIANTLIAKNDIDLEKKELLCNFIDRLYQYGYEDHQNATKIWDETSSPELQRFMEATKIVAEIKNDNVDKEDLDILKPLITAILTNEDIDLSSVKKITNRNKNLADVLNNLAQYIHSNQSASQKKLLASIFKFAFKINNMELNKHSYQSIIAFYNTLEEGTFDYSKLDPPISFLKMTSLLDWPSFEDILSQKK